MVLSVNKKYLLFSIVFVSSYVFGTIIDFGTDFPINPEWATASGAPTLASTALDAADEKLAFVFPIKGDVTFRRFGYTTGAITTGATLQVRLETVRMGNIGAIPTDTLYCADSSTTFVLASTDDNRFMETGNLPTDCTVSNSTVAIVVARRGSFVGNLTTMSVGRLDTALVVSSISTNGYQYASSLPNIVMFSSSETIISIYGAFGISSITATSFNSGSTPNTIGNVFTFPWATRVTGFSMSANYTNADLVVKLWDSDGATVLESVDVSTGLFRAVMKQGLKFSTYYDFAANESYRITATPKSTTNVILYRYGYDSTDIKNDNVQFGSYIQETSGTDPAAEGDWTQRSLFTGRIFPFIRQIDTGSGSSTCIGVIGN